MLTGISILCFAASYSVSLALECTRPLFRFPARMPLIIGFSAAGLLAHAIYLWMLTVEVAPTTGRLSNWFGWCLAAAWIVAAAYVGLAVSRPRVALGLFLLPLVLGLVGLAHLARELPDFSSQQTAKYWFLIHGTALLLGTVAILVGFSSGIMYLVQAFRLKRKLPPRPGLQLPSLELLQVVNERMLVISAVLLFAGVVAGVLPNVNTHGSAVVPWTDPVVWSSGMMLAWMIMALLFIQLYRPARKGRKVAYLTVASFIVFASVLAMTLWGEHASHKSEPPAGVVGSVGRPLDDSPSRVYYSTLAAPENRPRGEGRR